MLVSFLRCSQIQIKQLWCVISLLGLLLFLSSCGSGKVGPSSSSSASSSSSSSSNSSSSSSSSSTSGSTGNITIQESDSAFCQVDGFVESEHAGSTGEGYANAANEISAGLVWHVQTNSPGIYSVSIRYASGSTASRDGAFSVNGVVATTLPFNTTNAWTTWESMTTTVNLTYGYNTLALSALKSEGLANIDSLSLSGTDIRMGNCAIASISTVNSPLFVNTPSDFYAQTYTNGSKFISAFDWNFGGNSSATGKNVSHTFSESGTHTVTLTVTDTMGGQSLVKRSFNVIDSTGPVRVFIAGDSTVSTYTDTSSLNDQAGWGQMLHEQYSNQVTVFNHAIGGRTARRFIDEGRLDAIWKDIRAGDYLLVQFGTNDGHKTASYTLNGQEIPYYLDPNTDFKYWLQKYVDGAKSKGLKLVFVTPPPRNSAYCTGGNGTGAHAQAMRELAATNNIPVADLNTKSVNYLKSICPSPNPENFFLLRADGTVDGTHFQENGARKLSSMVADGLGEANLSINQFRL